MSDVTVSLPELFGTDNSEVIADKFTAFKSALASAPKGQFSQGQPFVPEAPVGAEVDTALAALTMLEKSVGGVSADTIASIKATLASQQADIVKDLTLTSPLATGLVAYDLEAPAKILAPRPTPLRNRLPRTKGSGTARRFKRITGITGSGTGGVGVFHPGITDSTTTAFGSINYNRGAKIAYAGDEAAVPYLQFSASSSVPWSAQYAGAGFQDARQLDQTTLLYSSMLLEERMLLGGRGTASGFSGAITAAGTPTLTVRNAAAGENGNTANIANLYVYVTAVTLFGETVAVTATTTGMSAATGKVVDVSLPAIAGAQGYRVYAGTTNAAASVFPPLLTISNGTIPRATLANNTVATLVPLTATDGAVTINFAGGGTGGAPSVGANPPTVATDSQATGYDGILPIVQGPNTGYHKHLGTTFSSNPADEYNVAFAQMYENVKADPDEVYMNGFDRKQLSDLIKLNSNTSAYRIAIDAQSSHGMAVGSLVNQIQNEVTGKMVDITVHPWLPQGVSPILSWTLPMPDSEVSNVWQVVNVQDYMAVEWPVTQFAYERSSYWFGTFLCYAPAWNGCLSGIVRK